MESLKAVKMIIADLSDRELLDALSVALLDVDESVLKRLSKEQVYDNAEGQANLMIVKTIAEMVIERIKDEMEEAD